MKRIALEAPILVNTYLPNSLFWFIPFTQLFYNNMSVLWVLFDSKNKELIIYFIKNNSFVKTPFLDIRENETEIEYIQRYGFTL